MPKATYFKQVVVRLYEQPYHDLKALAKSKGESEAEIIRIAVDRYLSYAKRGKKGQETQP